MNALEEKKWREGRRHDCVTYSACLDKAAKENVEHYFCRSCANYRRRGLAGAQAEAGKYLELIREIKNDALRIVFKAVVKEKLRKRPDYSVALNWLRESSEPRVCRVVEMIDRGEFEALAGMVIIGKKEIAA